MGYQEDYNQTLFLQAYGNAKPLKQNDEYQRYFTYECGIANPRAYHEQLIADGFLIPSSTAETLKGYKVAQLKELCDAFGIVKTGKKQDIIERLVQNVAPDLLKNYTNKEQCYSLSEKGADFLSQHKDYIELHRKFLAICTTIFRHFLQRDDTIFHPGVDGSGVNYYLYLTPIAFPDP